MMTKSSLYSKWILANGMGEMLGLGLTFLVGYGIVALFGEIPGWLGMLFTGLLMTATGVIEGGIVGVAQWGVIRHVFQAVTQKAWVLSTIIGALAAWFVGSLPFTLINLMNSSQASGSSAGMTEPPQWLVLLLAAGVGIVAGAFLSFFQWLILRRYARRAGWWLPANALAWAAGMPVIFAMMDLVFSGINTFLAILLFALGLFLTGVIVGLIHGSFLFWKIAIMESDA